MSWSILHRSLRSVRFAALTLGALATAMVGAFSTSAAAQSNSPAATFPANAGTLGAVPDAQCTGPGRSVTFTVSGLTGSPTNVSVDFTMSPAHTWVGDLDVVLIAPGGTVFHYLFLYTGNVDETGNGDSSDVAGPYTFNDAATLNWWSAATATTGTAPIPAGAYRTSDISGALTLMNPAFAGLADANGTWTLRFNDCAQGDTGSVSAASLTIETGGGGSTPTDSPVDFNGDGKTDYALVRNTGGGPSGQLTWFIRLNGGSDFQRQWGLASDFWVPEDYDGDDKSDIAVWRPGAPGVAAFYILNSATNTVRIEAFGQDGDDPTVVGDYTGDNVADIAVYRPGATDTAQSTWFYRATPNGATVYQPWGLGADFPAPGDYDGDGKNDFVVQRAGTGSQANFWIRYASGGTDVFAFGLTSDLIVPGDYDGDNKTDLATIRGVGGVINWFYRSSATGNVIYAAQFGAAATDYPVPGDYDGDGRNDYAIWRPGVNGGLSAFWVQSSATGAVTVTNYGLPTDLPVATYNVH